MHGETTLGLILNGGLARRMGGLDKGLLTLAGKPMIARVADRLRPQCAALAISANGDPAAFAPLGLPVLADDPPDFAGPLAGVLAGLEYCARMGAPLAWVASLPADIPFAPHDLVARLRQSGMASKAELAVAASGGRVHHLAALWPVALEPVLRRALVEEGLRKAQSFLSRFRVAVVEWPSSPFDPFMNVNDRQDLARAKAMLGEGSDPGAL